VKDKKHTPDALDIAIEKYNALSDEERTQIKKDENFTRKMQSSAPDKLQIIKSPSN